MFQCLNARVNEINDSEAHMMLMVQLQHLPFVIKPFFLSSFLFSTLFSFYKNNNNKEAVLLFVLVVICRSAGLYMPFLYSAGKYFVIWPLKKRSQTKDWCLLFSYWSAYIIHIYIFTLFFSGTFYVIFSNNLQLHIPMYKNWNFICKILNYDFDELLFRDRKREKSVSIPFRFIIKILRNAI